MINMINIIIPSNGQTFGVGRVLPLIRHKGIRVQMSYDIIPKALNYNYRTKQILDADNMLNIPSRIELCNNKRISRFELRKSLPQNTPKVYIPGRHFCKFPLVLRPDYHYGGHDFFVANSYEEMFALVKAHPNISHGIEAIHPNEEFRVWCGKQYDNKIISLKFQIKEPTKDDGSLMPKNHRLGNAIFKFVKEHKYKDIIRNVAKQAFMMSGLHIGAVDVLFDTKKEIPFVLEINPRFGINTDSTAEAVAKYLITYYKDWEKQ